MTLHLNPSNDSAAWIAVRLTCPACGESMRPLGEGQTSGVTAFLPVKCTRKNCRREWAVKTQLLAVTDQAHHHYLGVA